MFGVGMICILVWFVLIFYVSLNSYGHVGTVILLNNTLLLGKFEQVVNQNFVHINSLLKFCQ